MGWAQRAWVCLERVHLGKELRVKNRYYSGPLSDHFDGTYFFNSKDETLPHLSDLRKWKLFENRAK